MTAPARFGDLVGHAAVTRRLRAAAANHRVGSAYLFFGEPGIGKRTLATLWARLLQCASPTGEPALEPCGACRSCRQHAAGTHPDWSVLEPEDASVVTIDQVRRLHERLPYQPLTSSRRVVLIPEAARLSLEASNALLKVLEEPPTHVVFLLATAQRDRILPTILSRCQAVRCASPPPEAIVAHLTEGLGVPAADARRFVSQAQGRIGSAIDLATNRDAAALSFDDVGAPDTIGAPPRLLEVAERVGKDQEALRALLAWLSLWLRDVLAWQLSHDPGRLLHEHRLADVQWWAGRLTAEDVLDAAAGVHALWLALARNLNPQLAAEVTLLHLSLRLSGRQGPRRSAHRFSR